MNFVSEGEVEGEGEEVGEGLEEGLGGGDFWGVGFGVVDFGGVA